MRVLLGDIVGGAVGEGERLPSLTELGAQFRVSTGVVRECQRALAERGLVSVRHGRRAIVLAESEWDVFDQDVLAALVRARRTEGVLVEYLEARRVLEVEAAGLAAERATAPELERLSRAFGADEVGGRAGADQPGGRAALPAGGHRLPPSDHPGGRQPPAGPPGGADPPGR